MEERRFEIKKEIKEKIEDSGAESNYRNLTDLELANELKKIRERLIKLTDPLDGIESQNFIDKFESPQETQNINYREINLANGIRREIENEIARRARLN